MHTPVNKLIVTIEKKFYDSVAFKSGQVIHFDPSWHPEEYAMLKAVVYSIPNGIIQRRDYKGVTIPLQVGDEILMRYDVVYSYRDQPERDTPIYKNLLLNWNETLSRYEELWLCDILQVFGIIKNGEITMINGYVLLDPIIQRRSNSEILITPENYSKVQVKERAIVRSINSPNIPVKPGDSVYINPQTVMEYQIDLNKFYIIKDTYLLAKVTETT